MSTKFLMTRRVQFAETDAVGVLHFANYFRLIEEVEHAFWRSIGLSVITTDGGRRISWPRVAASCEYLAPVRFEQEIELAFRIDKISDQSITYEVEFRCHGKPVAMGKTTAVCCTMAEDKFKAVAIPESIRSKLTHAMTAAG